MECHIRYTKFDEVRRALEQRKQSPFMGEGDSQLVEPPSTSTGGPMKEYLSRLCRRKFLFIIASEVWLDDIVKYGQRTAWV